MKPLPSTAARPGKRGGKVAGSLICAGLFLFLSGIASDQDTSRMMFTCFVVMFAAAVVIV